VELKTGFWRGIQEKTSSALVSLLESSSTRRYRWLSITWLVVLYLLGIVAFGLFFNWGNFNLEYHDWAQITGPRLEFLRSAFQAWQFPLHISDSEALHFATLRYLSVPDAIISPQFLLLYKLPLAMFSLVTIWLLYTLGFAGLLVLQRKLKLSIISFSVLFLLFNYNGHILAHLNVGHLNWTGYFLFPWFAWLVFRLLEGDRSWLWTTLTSVLLLTIWLQGSYHQFLWLLIMLAVIGIFVPRTFWTVIRTGAFTFLVSAFRLLPCILSYQVYKQHFINGYPSLYSILDNLVNITEPVGTPFYANTLLGTAPGEWELTAFIGMLGAVIFIYFGIYRGMIDRKTPYRAMLFPLGVLLLLSIGPVYELFIKLPIPLLQGERVSSRMFSVVLVFGLILGVERLQRWLDSSSTKLFAFMGSLLGLAFIVIELYQDARIWQVSSRLQDFWIYFNPAKWYVKNNYTDTIYLWLVFGGLAISITTIIILAVLSWKEHPVAQPIIKESARPALFILLSWGISCALILIGWKLNGLASALIIHAAAAPLLLGGLAWLYYRKPAHTQPLLAALLVTVSALALDGGIVSLFFKNGFTIFTTSPATWIGFILVFASIYLAGKKLIGESKSTGIL
jgi:hypothetical protein